MAAPEPYVPDPASVTFRYTNHLLFPNQYAETPGDDSFILWRDLFLHCPISCQVIPDDSQLSVKRMWRDVDRKPLVKLQHPNIDYASSDYWVRWVTQEDAKRAYVMLQMPLDWAGEKDTKALYFIVRFSQGELFTIGDEQFPEALARIQDDQFRTCGQDEPELLFAVMPAIAEQFAADVVTDVDTSIADVVSSSAVRDYHDDLENRKYTRQHAPRISCAACHYFIEDPQAESCSHCGAIRTAPVCTQCGNFVSHDRNFYSRMNDYPWNYGWDGKCVSCGFSYETDFVAVGGHRVSFERSRYETLLEMLRQAGGSDRGSPRLNTEQLAQLLAVGPTQDLLAGSTKIRIELGESHLSEYEHADTQATIVISFDRAQDCTHDAPGGLLGNASIALTVEEWRALSEQLNGPLKVLLERKPYSTDLG